MSGVEHNHAPVEQPKRGRVLRVKYGYNPNSSSVGTIVFAMPAAMIGLTIAFGAVAGILGAALLKRRDESDEGDEPLDGGDASPESDG